MGSKGASRTLSKNEHCLRVRHQGLVHGSNALTLLSHPLVVVVIAVADSSSAVDDALPKLTVGCR